MFTDSGDRFLSSELLPRMRYARPPMIYAGKIFLQTGRQQCLQRYRSRGVQ